MDREVRGESVRNREPFRRQVRSMSDEEIALLSDSLRERVEELAEELQVLAEHTIASRERVAAIRSGRAPQA